MAHRYIQPPKLDKIDEAKKCMLKGTRYRSTHGGTAAVLLYNGGSIVELNEAKKQVESMQKEVTHFGRSL